MRLFAVLALGVVCSIALAESYSLTASITTNVPGTGLYPRYMNAKGVMLGEISSNNAFYAGRWVPGTSPTFVLPTAGVTIGNATYRAGTPAGILDDGTMVGYHNLPWAVKDGNVQPLLPGVTAVDRIQARSQTLLVQRQDKTYFVGSGVASLTAISVPGFDSFQSILLDRSGAMNGVARDVTNGQLVRFRWAQGGSFSVVSGDPSWNIRSRNVRGDVVIQETDGGLTVRTVDGTSYTVPAGFTLDRAGLSEFGQVALNKGATSYLWNLSGAPVSTRTMIGVGAPSNWLRYGVTSIADFDFQGRALVELLSDVPASWSFYSAGLLTPVPEPTTILAVVTGVATLALRRRATMR